MAWRLRPGKDALLITEEGSLGAQEAERLGEGDRAL